MELVAGPLRALDGPVTFAPVGSNGCRIELQAAFRILDPLNGALLDGLLESTATSMVQAS